MMRPTLCALWFALASSAAESSLCAFKDADCSFSSPLRNPSRPSCVVKYYPTNGSECAALVLEKPIERARLGDVDLNPYVWDYKNEHHFKYTLFNVSFADIRWKHMTFRFRLVENEATKELKNHCREIIYSAVEPTSVRVLPLHYDCHWSDQDRRYENETFVFEYLATNDKKTDYKKYAFKVPPVKNLEESNGLFMYVDLTEPKEILLHAALHNWNYTSRRFRVDACFADNEKYSAEYECETYELIIDGADKSVFPYEAKRSGWYSFKITLVDPACSPDCVSTNSVKFYIDCHNIVYTVLWNILWVCTAFGIIFTIVWIVKRLRRRYKPNVLIMYSHCDNFHLPILNLICKYMQNELNWEVNSDNEIRFTEHNDPYIWCEDACSDADCILYFCKPLDCKIPHSDTVNYANADVDMDKIFFKIIKSPKKKNIRLYNVVLKNCGEPDVPYELRKIRTFYLVDQWDNLVNSILKNNWFDKIIRPIPKLKDSILGRDFINACSNKLRDYYS